jgi:hypothetical protein
VCPPNVAVAGRGSRWSIPSLSLPVPHSSAGGRRRRISGCHFHTEGNNVLRALSTKISHMYLRR